jgi:hypothetical protein
VQVTARHRAAYLLSPNDYQPLSLISIQLTVNIGHNKVHCDTPDSSLRTCAVALYLC